MRPHRTSDGGALPPYNTPTPPVVPSPLRSRDPSSEREKSFGSTPNLNLNLPDKLELNGSNGVESEKPANGNGVSNTEGMSIQFAIPARPAVDQHISFAEPMRPRKDAKEDNTTLRIPSPREYERGGAPTAVRDDIDALSLSQAQTMDVVGEPLRPVISLPLNPGGAPNVSSGRAVTVERSSGLSGMLRQRKPHLPSALTLEAAINRIKRRRAESPASRLSRSKSFYEQEPKPYLSYTPTIGRNSAFVDLTDEQREELGGIEYRSLKTLSRILLMYFVGWNFFGFIIHLAGIMKDRYYGSILTEQSISRPWW